MIEIDDKYYGEVIKNMEEKVFMTVLRGFGMPDDTLYLFQCLIKAGCPVDAVMRGLFEYSEYLNEKYPEGENDGNE